MLKLLWLKSSFVRKLRVHLSCLIFILLTFTSCWASPKISPSENVECNLGNLEEGVTYKRSFRLNNIGDSDLEVNAVNVGCGCTTIVYPLKPTKIAPQGSIEIKFKFNTEGMDGQVTKYVYIESNDPRNPFIKIKLLALVKKDPKAVTERFISFGLLTILNAGLIDGINPCAFTVLVFFISFLTFVGYRKRELIVLGITFILSVFVTYILIGLGLFKFIQSLEVFSALSKVIYFAVTCLAIILGFYSLYDWYIYNKTGNPEKTKLRLPDFIKLKIQKIIQDSSRNKNRTLAELAIAIALSGFAVSLLESVCTGQTYLPTVVYVLRDPYLRSRAFLYLVLYNIMFIVPLAAILIAALLGVKSETFAKLARKHLGIIKLLSAALFFLLGILLLKVSLLKIKVGG